MELWLSRHFPLPLALYHVNTCRLCGAKKNSSEPILLSNSRGVFSPRNSQTAAFSINLIAIHCLVIQSFSFIPFRLVLTLNEFRIYKVISVGLS